MCSVNHTIDMTRLTITQAVETLHQLYDSERIAAHNRGNVNSKEYYEEKVAEVETLQYELKLLTNPKTIEDLL
jgi:hypothetical protein